MKEKAKNKANTTNISSSVNKHYLILGWTVILICTMLIYNALLFSSLKKETENSLLASAHIMADNLALNIQSGLRFGKKLHVFHGLDQLIKQNDEKQKNNDKHHHTLPMAVLNNAGALIQSSETFPAITSEIVFTAMQNSPEKPQTITITNNQYNGTLLLYPLIQHTELKGFIAVFIDETLISNELYSLFGKQLIIQFVIGLGGFLILALLLYLPVTKYKEINPEKQSRRIKRICILTFLFVLLLNGILVIFATNTRYIQTLKTDASNTAELVSNTLDKLVIMGITFNNMNTVNTYLNNIATIHNNSLVFKIYNENKQLKAQSHMAEKTLTNSQKFPIHIQKIQDTQKKEKNWNMDIAINFKVWLTYLRSITLDMLTIVIISVIFMTELFLLLTRGLEYIQANPKNNKQHNIISEPINYEHSTSINKTNLIPLNDIQKNTVAITKDISTQTNSKISRSVLMRPLIFFVFFAINQSISFIPLRMNDLLSAENIQNALLSGLPVSTEMGMTGISALIAGTWIKKKGIKLPFLSGLSFLCLGYVFSMLANNPWLFIFSRGIVGIGYGLTLLTAQAFTVKDGMLADMFAGAYAGILCGSALGAMIAERLNYTAVFCISAIILLCFIPFALLILKNETKNSAQKTPHAKNNKENNTHNNTSLRQTLSAIADKQFLSFVLLNHIPFAMLCVGFLNFFLPIYLKSVDTSQSDIGRIFMLNCLLVVYSGPIFSHFVLKISCKNKMVSMVGILAAMALFTLSFLPPLLGSVLGAILLGTAVGLSIPAQSEYFLDLEICKKLGTDQSMSLLDVLQRIGQVLGPLSAGVALQSMNIDSVTRNAGIGFLIISVLFLIVTHKKPNCFIG